MISSKSIKYTALFIVVTIWLLNNLFKLQKATINLPLIFKNIPENHIITDISIAEVPVEIEGIGFKIVYLLLFQRENAYIEINSKNYVYWNNIVQIQKNDIKIPNSDSFNIKKIDLMQNVTVKLDRFETKNVPLILQYDEEKDREFFTQNMLDLETNSIQLQGPETLLREHNHVYSEKLKKSLLKDNTLEFGVLQPSEFISVNPESLILKIRETTLETLTLPLIPIQYPHKENLIIIPQKVTVQIQGSAEIIKNIRTESIRAYLTEKDLIEAGLTDIRLNLPVGISLIDHTPKQVQVIFNE